MTASYYLNGVAILLLMSLPALHIFFNLSPVNLSVAFSVWLASYLLFYGLQVVLAFYSMGGFRLETIVIAMASFPIYVKALTNVIFHREISWQATGDTAQRNDPLNFVTAQIMLFTFLIFTTIAGFWKFYYTVFSRCHSCGTLSIQSSLLFSLLQSTANDGRSSKRLGCSLFVNSGSDHLSPS